MKTRTLLSTLIILPIITLFISGISFGETAFDMMFKTSNKYQDVVVKEVLSSDTFKLESGEKIKLIGLRALKAPERKKERPERDEHGFRIEEPESPLTPVEEKAFTFAVELLEGKHVRLELDNTKIDSNNNTLAYAFLLDDNVFVNKEILRNGFAHLQIRIPNTKYADQLREAYKEATIEKRGVQGE
ncbi:MAG: thermonuclease family protein [Candidatus Omnitrophica bacterium]|nr:thermonuclease family protein [Candidatus Omnitrophota bacterium]